MTIFHLIQYPVPFSSVEDFSNLPPWIIWQYLDWFKKTPDATSEQIIEKIKSLLYEYDPEVHDK